MGIVQLHHHASSSCTPQAYSTRLGVLSEDDSCHRERKASQQRPAWIDPEARRAAAVGGTSSSTGPRGGSHREEGCRVAHAPSGQPSQLQHPALRVGPGLELALCKHLLDERDGRAVVARPVVMVCRRLLHRCCALLSFADAPVWSAGKARVATAGHLLLHSRCLPGTSGSLQGRRRSSAGAPGRWASLLR